MTNSNIYSANIAPFPQKRMRRLRCSSWLRDLVQESHLHPQDLIWPTFVIDGQNQKEPIPSLPDVYRFSIDNLIEECRSAECLGIRAVALFPVIAPEKKTDDGREAWNPDNLLCRAVSAVKSALPNLGVITDVALDPYTTHGHDGVLDKAGRVLNDETLESLCKQALVQSKARADILAPSDMMDGRVGAIRNYLDEQNFQDKLILSYAVKYASAFYGPFRDAVRVRGLLKGDKKTYQMNPANADEALHEAALDLQEGADILMVKPGLPYLDVISAVKFTFRVPTFAYHVSGEYAMLRAASDKGWLDYEQVLLESMMAFKRAGADAVFTYAARDVAKILGKN